MRANLALGLSQGVFLPHPLPHAAGSAASDDNARPSPRCSQCDVGIRDVGGQRGNGSPAPDTADGAAT